MKKPFEQFVDRIGQVILGKADQIRLAMTCLFAGGHLLIEDIPGIGKTTLAKALSRCMGLDFNRIQCTSDMLPGDIIGVSVFDRKDGRFVFHPGPIFTQVLLADEINRATPKTQSALLEAMEEKQVTADGRTRRLKHPFFVIATQNPVEQAGTYPLPESQLDRFLMRISLGYPERAAEKRLLLDGDARQKAVALTPCMTQETVVEIRRRITRVHTSDALIDYLQDLLDYTRQASCFAAGLSPRAGLDLLRATRTWAFLDGRSYAVPEDLQAVLPWVVGHRLRSRDDLTHFSADALAERLKEVPVP